jgi:ribose 5-phosphate isomerase B
MRVGIATDHGGFWLKEDLLAHLKAANHDVVDFGAHNWIQATTIPILLFPLPGR